MCGFGSSLKMITIPLNTVEFYKQYGPPGEKFRPVHLTEVSAELRFQNMLQERTCRIGRSVDELTSIPLIGTMSSMARGKFTT